MDKDKSFLEKITDTMKDIASIAADAADSALKANEAPPKADERSAAYIPLAADGLVSDPMMVPPIAAAHAPRRKRATSKRAAKASKTRQKGRQKIRREGSDESYGQEIEERCQKPREENQSRNSKEGAQGKGPKATLRGRKTAIPTLRSLHEIMITDEY